uniref:RING-type domain-containing protein n=1 Tax=Zea mays TaxID=4577 RepID=A0A804RKG5_MAIZE
MTDMNSDEILEVPDTPDRLQQSKYHVSSSIVGRDGTMAAANPSPQRKFRIRFKNNSVQGSSSQNNGCSILPAALDTDHIFKQAEAAQILELSKDYKAKFSLQKPDSTRISVDSEKRAGKHGFDQSRSISNNISCSVTGGRNPTFQVKDGEVGQQDAGHQSANFLDIGPGFPTIQVGKPGYRLCTRTTDKLKGVTGADVCPGSSSGEVKGDLITNKVIAGPTSPLRVFPRRHVGQKRLVRNGCISPSNIAKTDAKVNEKQEMCSLSEHLDHPHQPDAFDGGDVIDLTENSPIMTRQRSEVNNKLMSGHNMDTRAAKKLRTDRFGRTLVRQSKCHANNSSCSEVSLSGLNNNGKGIDCDILDSDQTGEANLRGVDLSTAGTYLNKNFSDISTEQGWRTTHNHTSKLPISFMGNITSSSGWESGSSTTRSNQNHGSAGGKHSSVSGANIIVPDKIGNKTIMLGRERRKQTSTSSHIGESSSAADEPREAQLESDELLARQLQEQLYNESARFAPTEEIDAIVAMSLQHEEDTHRTSRTLRRFQNHTRGARATRLSSYRNALRAELATANNMISRQRNTAPINLGLRAALARYPGALHIQPNIDLNDYDALLALDENNHQHTGASESQINNLPQSVVQSNSIEDPCSVCLENPSVGDTIRHLPCFHKFHKECIDEWLRRKKLCPVCKFGIN